MKLQLTEQFIIKAISIHGKKYDYSKVVYENNLEKVIIICNICSNEFKQIPNNHLRGKGCKKCANKLNAEKRRKPNEQIILEAKNIHKEVNYLGKNYGELYQKTLEREQQIKDLGYNLVVMWEYDWNKINKSIRTLQRKFKSLH